LTHGRNGKTNINGMAKVTIEFDSIEDKEEMEMCLNGMKWYLLAWELDQYLRGRLKYEPMIDKEYEVLQQTRDKLHELRGENGLTFD
jgi:hypothetical protein